MKPKKINTFHADTSDIDKEEVGEYWPYDGLPTKIGDLVVLKIFPEFEDPLERVDYIQVKKYPPDYLVLAKVTRIVNKYGAFFCTILDEDVRVCDEGGNEL